ncbi:fimbrial protein [Pseudomonas sp. SDO5271_S396]
MGHLIHDAWPVFVAALLLSCSSILEVQAADNLKFKGKLVREACTIRPGDDAITLELWDVTSKHLYINTRSVGKPFKLHLEDCDTSIGNSVTITFGGAENRELPGLLALDGGSGASGIGVGIETPGDEPLPLNAVSDKQLLVAGSNVIELKAYVKGEPSAIRDQSIGHGAYTATSTFTLDYP